ncbi:glycosyltransferase family 4 protein [Candidatus Chlorohelix sp.]|uniref:glycosyltransferase family 4 protein n=1 Tax=Candidatus Chlorohelix sp. TaxID=3139201 RepID=UPI003043EBC4
MKFLVVSHHLPPNYKSGAELYAFRQALWLQNKGNIVRAVCVEDIEAPVSALEVKQDNYMGLDIERLYFNRLSYPNPLEASHYNPEIRDWMENFLREYKPDLMLVNACYLLGVGILEAAKKCGVPVVLTLHDFWFLCQRINLMKPDGSLCDGNVTGEDCALCLANDKRRYLVADQYSGNRVGKIMVQGARSGFTPLSWLLGGTEKIETLTQRRIRLKKAFDSVQAIIAPSSQLKQMFIKNGFTSEKIQHCRIGLDQEKIKALEVAKQTKNSKRIKPGLHIGFLGQVLPHKGLDVLLEAFRHLSQPDIILTIYGPMGRDKSYEKKIKELVSKDTRIKFAGTYLPEELTKIMSELDTVIVPSVCYENSPLVILEAQAAGVPVIASNLGGMAELVKHEKNGLLFERGNPRDLAAQITKLLEQDSLLEQLRTGAIQVKTLDEEFSELTKIYQDVLQNYIVVR